MKVGPQAVRLPRIESVPEHLRDAVYVVRSLLTHGDDNTKLHKSNASDKGYLTYGLSLAPAWESGRNVCPQHSEGCEALCLHHQGKARVWDTVKLGRVAKTVAFFQHRRWFAKRLRQELDHAQHKAQQAKLRLAVRLNVFSDLRWETIFPWVFSDFPSVRLYDYTKLPRRMLSWCDGLLPRNYHLTFSRSEDNERDCVRVLAAGGNVAVVFRGAFPERYLGHPVVSGDETDLRFLDPPGVVVGLSAKGTARRDPSGFVVETSRRVALSLSK